MLRLQLKLIIFHEDGSLFLLDSAVQKNVVFYGFCAFFHLEPEDQIAIICSRLAVAEMGLLMGAVCADKASPCTKVCHTS